MHKKLEYIFKNISALKLYVNYAILRVYTCNYFYFYISAADTGNRYVFFSNDFRERNSYLK